jgi:hypothetical protein
MPGFQNANRVIRTFPTKDAEFVFVSPPPTAKEKQIRVRNHKVGLPRPLLNSSKIPLLFLKSLPKILPDLKSLIRYDLLYFNYKQGKYGCQTPGSPQISIL